MHDQNFEGLRYPWEEPPAEGAAIEVAAGVLWMRLPLPMKLDHVNVYALDDGDSWTVIDTGFASRRSRAIWETLLKGPMGGKPVARVIVTHHHPDHVGLAGWFQSEHGAELITTRTAWLFSRMLMLDEQAVPAPETLEKSSSSERASCRRKALTIRSGNIDVHAVTFRSPQPPSHEEPCI